VLALTARERENRTYVEIMNEARTRVSLDALGVHNLKVKRAIMGGFLLKIFDENSIFKADALAKELKIYESDVLDDHQTSTEG